MHPGGIAARTEAGGTQDSDHRCSNRVFVIYHRDHCPYPRLSKEKFLVVVAHRQRSCLSAELKILKHHWYGRPGHS
jgi:hypothetical protein